MKKKLAFLLAVIMVFSAVSGAITVVADSASSHSLALKTKLLSVQNEGSDTSFGIWGGTATTDEAHSGTNAIKLVGNGSYVNYSMWSGGGNLSKDNTYVVSFYVKGTAASTISFDFEGYGSYCSSTSYTLTGSDWEKVEFTFTPAVAPNAGDHTSNGYPFRVYTQGSDTFYIDDVAIWSTQDTEKANSVKVDAWKTNVSYDSKSDDTDRGSWTIDGATTTTVDGAFGNGVKLTKVGTNNGIYFWCGNDVIVKDKEALVTFYVKGTAGESVMFDLDDGSVAVGSHTFATNDWEAVAVTVKPTKTFGNAGCGFSFRVYSSASEFCFDELHIATLVETTDLLTLEANEDGGFALLKPGNGDGYGAFYFRNVALVGGETYTVSVDVMANNTDVNPLFDIEGTTISATSLKPSAKDTWETKSFNFDAEASGNTSGIRAYVADATNKGQVLLKNFVITDSEGTVVAKFTGKTSGGEVANAEIVGQGEYIAFITPPTDLTTLEVNEYGGFVELQSKKTVGGYGALYIDNVPMTGGVEYTLTVDVMTNNAELNPMFDLEGQADVGSSTVAPSAIETWETKTVTFTPNTSGSFPVRIYLNETTNEGEVLVKNLTVKAGEETVAAFSGKEATRVAGNAKYYEYTAPVVKTNLFDLASCKDGGFLAFQPTANNGYAAYYMRAKLDANKTYTLKFKAISNTEGATLMADLEGNGGMDTTSVIITEADTWKEYTVTVKATSRWQDSANADIAEMGWPLRVYFNNPVDAQIFIDDIELLDGTTPVISQNFVKGDIEGIVTWFGGNATHIPAGYVPEKEGEILGYNELINGDFEDASLMKYWWNRTDWNGGKWAREEGMGVNGSAGLVARGTGAGTSDQNAGVFYTIMGEGKEASLDLEEGKTYVLKYKVFRPNGVDSYTYIDINEGQVVTAAASLNGEWEEVTARFVAPAGVLKIRAVSNALAEGEYVVIDDIELRQVGGDPNGNPKTGDAMPIALFVVMAVVSVGACAVIVLRKKAC